MLPAELHLVSPLIDREVTFLIPPRYVSLFHSGFFTGGLVGTYVPEPGSWPDRSQQRFLKGRGQGGHRLAAN